MSLKGKMTMGLFKRKSRPDVTAAEATPVAAATRAAEAAPAADVTPAGKPFPRVEILLRRESDSRQLVDALRSAGASDADIPVAEAVAPGLVALITFDEGNRYVDLSAHQLAQVGLTPVQARRGARERLRAAASGLTIEGGNGRFRVSNPAMPDTTASFMLVADAWLDASAVQGDPVFAVGTRELLHVCGSQDAAALDGLRQLAATLYQEGVDAAEENGVPLTPQLLVLRDGVLSELGD